MRCKAIKVNKKLGVKIRDFLLDYDLLNKELKVEHDSDHILFPLIKSLSPGLEEQLSELAEFEIVEIDFDKRMIKPKNLKEALANKLTQEELDKLITSFDTLGDVIIIEIPETLEHKEKIIAQAILDVNPNVESVYKITAAHGGEFRVRPVTLLAGEPKTQATYKESGTTLKISLGKVFFSPRLGGERSRISKLIKQGEIIGAFFAGVGPFPIVFAKNSEMEKAYAIELNPIAVEDMEKNIKLNHVEQKVIPILGDVKEIVPKEFVNFFDRIVMPLPKTGEDFLKYSIMAIKKNGVVHFYQFVDINNPFEKPLKIIEQEAQNANRKFEVLSKKIVRSFSPSTVQVVLDVKFY